MQTYIITFNLYKDGETFTHTHLINAETQDQAMEKLWERMDRLIYLDKYNEDGSLNQDWSSEDEDTTKEDMENGLISIYLLPNTVIPELETSSLIALVD